MTGLLDWLDGKPAEKPPSKFFDWLEQKPGKPDMKAEASRPVKVPEFFDWLDKGKNARKEDRGENGEEKKDPLGDANDAAARVVVGISQKIGRVVMMFLPF